MSYHNNRKGKYSQVSNRKSKKTWPLWKVFIADALLLGIILVTFALFHHVLPAYINEYQRLKEMENKPQIQQQGTEQQPESESAAPVESEPEETEVTETLDLCR